MYMYVRGMYMVFMATNIKHIDKFDPAVNTIHQLTVSASRGGWK